MDEEEQEKLVTFHLDLSKVIFIWILAFGRICLGHFFQASKTANPNAKPQKAHWRDSKCEIPRKGFPPMMEKEGEKMAVFVGALFEKSHIYQHRHRPQITWKGSVCIIYIYTSVCISSSPPFSESFLFVFLINAYLKLLDNSSFSDFTAQEFNFCCGGTQ